LNNYAGGSLYHSNSGRQTLGISKGYQNAQSFTQDDGKVVCEMLPQPALLVPNKCYMLTAATVSAEFTPFAAELSHHLPCVLTWHI